MPLHRNPKIVVESSHKVFEGRIFDVLRERLILPSGLAQDLSIVDHNGAVAIAAVDEHGDLLLVRQYRHATGDWLLEVPAGRVERGEDRAVCARRELEEETGFRARSWEKLADFYTAPGFCSELLSLYLARDLVPIAGGGKAMDADEEIELVRRAPADVLRENPSDAKTMIAALLWMQRAARGA